MTCLVKYIDYVALAWVIAYLQWIHPIAGDKLKEQINIWRSAGSTLTLSYIDDIIVKGIYYWARSYVTEDS